MHSNMNSSPASHLADFATVEAPAGWDAYAVWRERVQDARTSNRRSTHPPLVVADDTAGWDPLETWRMRVQQPRATRPPEAGVRSTRADYDAPQLSNGATPIPT
jgi:hypothetical protein